MTDRSDSSPHGGRRFRCLSRWDVEHVLDMGRAIDLMAEAFAALSSGRASVPVRLPIDLEAPGASALVMPVYLPTDQELGLKLVTVHPDNAVHGLPTTHGLMIVLDASTGHPLALMDAETLTAVRTGAASGLATRLLAREDARVLAVFGAGGQARTQIEAVCTVRPIDLVWVFGRDRARAARFAASMNERLEAEVRLADDLLHLRDADVVCTATTSPVPVFEAVDLAPGCHVNAVGAYTPATREIPADVVAAAKVVVDQRAGCLAGAGDLLMAIDEGRFHADSIHAELGEIVLGERPGRVDREEVTLFKSVGNAAQDLAAASFVASRAEKLGLGTEIEL